MPRFILPSGDPRSDSASDDAFDDALDALYDHQQDRRARRPRRRNVPAAPVRVVAEGRSGRSVVDVDGLADDEDDPTGADARAELRDVTPEAPYSSYDVATHGPEPVPDWLVTALSARDTPQGSLKSGKEADVSLLERAVPGGASCLLAVKTYRSAEHRMFHRDAGYVEGRRVRRSRETRAMAKRTAFGRDLLAGRWATAEFGALSALWTSGARVPYPVQLIGSELMMQFIGAPDGSAAPRLAGYDGTAADFTDLWHDLIATLEVLAADGMTHGDLSAYNVLVDEDGCVLIDLPQVVDLIGNPQGMEYLARDCQVIAEFFARHGVGSADGDTLAAHLRQIATPTG